MPVQDPTTYGALKICWLLILYCWLWLLSQADCESTDECLKDCLLLQQQKLLVLIISIAYTLFTWAAMRPLQQATNLAGPCLTPYA